MIQNTGKIVTLELLEIIRTRANGVVDTPLIVVEGVTIHEAARGDFGEFLDQLAVAHGLPEPSITEDGEVVHYGITNEGEFTSWSADPNDCPEQDILET
jgi:hypothetical protein